MTSNFFALDGVDLKERAAAVVEQVVALKELNVRFCAECENLSEVIRYGRKERHGENRLRADEFRRFNAINDRANVAKHEGLGATTSFAFAEAYGADGSVGGGRRKPAPIEARTANVSNLNQPLQKQRTSSSWSAGSSLSSDFNLEDKEKANYKGELERVYSLHIGRPLRKNEPRYRFLPRPGNQGKFTAIVCLDALQNPVELIGDSYNFKKRAEHSAALQGLNHVEALGVLAGPCAPRKKADAPAGEGSTSGSRVRGGSHAYPPAWPQPQHQDQQEKESYSFYRRGRREGAEQEYKVKDHEHDVDSLLEIAFSQISLKTQSTGDCHGVTERSRRSQKHDDPKPCRRAEKAPQAGDAHCVGASASSNKGKGAEAGAPVSERGDLPPVFARSELDNNRHSDISLPSDAAVVRVLRGAGTPLPLREIYLSAMGRDPKTCQMGGGVRSGFAKRLKALKKKGLVTGPEGRDSWFASILDTPVVSGSQGQELQSAREE